MKNKFSLIVLAVLLAAALAACNPGKTDDNMTNDGGENKLEPDITGEVLEVQNDTVLRVLVDSVSDYVTGQVWVSVNEDTIFLDAQGEEIQPEDAESLFKVGETAAFLSTGEIMESYPMQATANAVFVE